MKKFLALLAVVTLTGCSPFESVPVEQLPFESYTEVTEYTTEPETECETEPETECETEPETSSPETPEDFPEEYTIALDDVSGEPSDAFADYDSDIRVEYSFRSKSQLEQHFEKHGGEFGGFGYETVEDYVKGANDVINNPDALYKTEAEDGDGVYYVEATNEFVVLSTDGYIRTYFRPSSGMSYFERQ